MVGFTEGSAQFSFCVYEKEVVGVARLSLFRQYLVTSPLREAEKRLNIAKSSTLSCDTVTL